MPKKTRRTCRKDKPFGKIASQWLEQNKAHWKESTYSKYYHVLNNVFADTIGMIPISDISEKLVQEQIDRIFESGLSMSSAKDYAVITNCVLGFASEKNYFCPEKVNVHFPKIQIKEMDVLDEKEQSALVEVLKNDINLTKLGVLFALYTGVRCGELCALQWKDIDLDERTVYISKTLQRVQKCNTKGKDKTTIITMSPKTPQSARRIPLPQFLADVLRGFQCGDGEAYLLTGNRKGFIEPRSMQNKFKRYLAECSIHGINFHALRHTFATRCIELGFDVKSLSEILGHSNVNITMNLYVHSSFDLKISNMEKFDNIL